MSGVTSRFAFPYPSSTDPLKEGAAKIRAFAEGADAAILNRTYAKSIITTEQTRENAAYGVMTTPDRVEVVMPENGLIAVGYQASWKQSASGEGASAALFLGANQLKCLPEAEEGSPSVQACKLNMPSGTYTALATCTGGLVTGGPLLAYSGDVTTGQIVGARGKFGICYIFAGAGTYLISVQFKMPIGSVTVKNRKLWAWSMF